jgi:hypothetical protein
LTVDSKKVRAELELARKNYTDIINKIINRNIPGVLTPADLISAKCDMGEIKCHGGSTHPLPEIETMISAKRLPK